MKECFTTVTCSAKGNTLGQMEDLTRENILLLVLIRLQRIHFHDRMARDMVMGYEYGAMETGRLTILTIHNME